jgi:beta-lactamase regulating signal transducer with metallopeptidase domain
MSATAWSGVLLPLGWTLVLVLWQTALLALLVSAWDRIRRASARRRHRNALAALLAAIPIGMLTFWALAYAPAPLRERAIGAREQIAALLEARLDAANATSQPAGTAGGRAASVQRGPADASSVGRAGEGPRLGRTVGLVIEWGAALWTVIVALLAGRLAGGLWLARRIRGRGVRIGSAELLEVVSGLARRLGIARPVELLESADVDAPIATGWRRPALILPLGLHATLSRSLLEPLIAHELEHVRRRDQLVAAVQALADALVFFSPGSRWLSGQARLAREQCCDDVAVRACGDPAAYAAALGALVGIVSEKPVGALGAEAPRLADRIRRVLEGEAMKRTTSLQVLLLVLAVVATSVSGLLVGAVSFADTVAQRPAAPIRDGAPNASDSAALGSSGDLTVSSRAGQPLGAPVSIIGYASRAGHVFETVHVRNVSEDRVLSITFAAVVEFWPLPEAGRRLPLPREPALVVRSNSIPVSLAPGEETDVPSAFLSWAELQGWGRTHAARPQLMLTAVAAEQAGSGTWEITPKPGARYFAEAFHIPAAFVSKALLGVRPANPLPNGLCRDDRGVEYSQGAIVTVSDGETGPVASEHDRSRAKPGFARCEEGVWRAYELPSALY